MSNKRSGAGLLGKDYQSRPLPQSNLSESLTFRTDPFNLSFTSLTLRYLYRLHECSYNLTCASYRLHFFRSSSVEALRFELDFITV